MTDTTPPKDFETIVDADGRTAWCTEDGIFGGDPEMAQAAGRAAAAEVVVEVFGHDIETSLDDPIGRAGALFAANPGRTVIVDAPDEVLDFLADYVVTEPGGPEPGWA